MKTKLSSRPASDSAIPLIIASVIIASASANAKATTKPEGDLTARLESVRKLLPPRPDLLDSPDGVIVMQDYPPFRNMPNFRNVPFRNSGPTGPNNPGPTPPPNGSGFRNFRNF